MADIPELTDWVLPKISKLNLAISRVCWVDKWLPGYYDYRVKMPFNGEVCVGRGIASVEKMAFEKAITEVFERASVKYAEFSECPWGTAGFPDRAGAQKRAYLELLGIDRALCHHFCRKRFTDLPLGVIEKKLDRRILDVNLKENNIELRLYEMTAAEDAKVVVALASGKNAPYPASGFVAGFGASDDISDAALQAVLECLRTAVAVFVGGERPVVSLDSLRKARSPWWHIWMLQTRKSEDYIKEHLLPKSGAVAAEAVTDKISIADARFYEITTLRERFPDIPLVFVQAKSNRLLRPQFGDYVGDPETVARLGVFSGGSGANDRSVPHFYG